ncbi:hypothetical protein JXB41_01570 [Candidatus Woesearchaeota archaeon]|jgi:hypothetical protein|nr:hypothetical protein [Candidatus Woesearchaeota archaeon]
MSDEEQKIEPNKESSKEEKIGFHKGSLSTLAKERQELARILQIVERLMQIHIGELKDMGVDLEKIAEKSKEESGKKEKKKPIEDIL